MTCSKNGTADSRLVAGYTTREHLLLDLDAGSRGDAEWLANYVMKNYPEVGDCILLKTSRGWHLVFDNRIGYNKACTIIEHLAEQGYLEPNYVRIRKFRVDMTLRVSGRWETTGYRPPPKLICRIHNPWNRRHDGLIKTYLAVWTAFQLPPVLRTEVETHNHH